MLHAVPFISCGYCRVIQSAQGGGIYTHRFEERNAFNDILLFYKVNTPARTVQLENRRIREPKTQDHT